MFAPLNAVAIPVAAALLIATVTDLSSRRIPNWLVAPFLLLGIAACTFTRGWIGLESSLLGVLSAIAILGMFCYVGGMGMGDLKLCAAVGAWIGPGQLVIALVMTGLVGAVMAILYAIAGGFLSESIAGAGRIVLGMSKRGPREHHTLTLKNPNARRMPYAPAIAIGTLLSFLS